MLISVTHVVHALYLTMVMHEDGSNEIVKKTKKSRVCPYAPSLDCKDFDARRTLLLWSLRQMHYKHMDYACHMEIIAEKVLSGSCFRMNRTFSYLSVSKKSGYFEKVMTKVDNRIAKIRNWNKCDTCLVSYGCTTDAKKVACAIILHRQLISMKHNGRLKRKKKQM